MRPSSRIWGVWTWYRTFRWRVGDHGCLDSMQGVGEKRVMQWTNFPVEFAGRVDSNKKPHRCSSSVDHQRATVLAGDSRILQAYIYQLKLVISILIKFRPARIIITLYPHITTCPQCSSSTEMWFKYLKGLDCAEVHLLGLIMVITGPSPIWANFILKLL
jgi:hypothetical protein